MWWLCVHLPHLPLEIFARTSLDSFPFAVVQGNGTQANIVTANAGARAAGIDKGMRLSAAQALVSALRTQARDLTAEQRALCRLAACAYRFTSHVRLGASTLLLEVAGSLRLFGGLAPLIAQLRERIHALGYRTSVSAGPTPAGAAALAYAGVEWHGQEIAAWRRLLAQLPLSALDIPADQRAALAACGLTRIAELTRLPRVDLAQRFGRELIDYMDRLYGRSVDAQAPYVLPERFEGELIFPAEVHDSAGVLFGAQRLLNELEEFLRVRDCGTQSLQFSLRHHRPPATAIALKLAAPRRAAAHFLDLLRERLQSVVLRDAVIELRLRVRHLHAWHGGTGDLFGAEREGATAVGELQERLQARLGDTAVQGLDVLARHTPERAWCYRSPTAAAVSAPEGLAPLRPLWLLPQPQSLTQGLGDWQLIAGPERIETGWWEHDIARDYFVAQDQDGARYWLYCEYRAPDAAAPTWFVQGIFA